MHNLPAYTLIGGPQRYKNGRGRPSTNYLQKFRLNADPARKVKSVSLKTKDKGNAILRAKEYVEKRIREDQLKGHPELRAIEQPIETVVNEYICSLRNSGCSPKHVDQTDFRLSFLIREAGLKRFGEISDSKVKAAISAIKSSGQFSKNSTGNKYLESVQAFTRWMFKEKRWPCDLLDVPHRDRRIKGDNTNSRPRAILTQGEFENLLRIVVSSPTIRNLTGAKRFWLYLIASQTGLRAQEIHSLMPSSFHLVQNAPYVEITNTISKRGKLTGKSDQIRIKVEFAEMLKPWLNQFPHNKPLFDESRSWWYKAASVLRKDLKTAEIPFTKQTSEGRAVVDFHSFRGLMITNAMRTGMPQHIAMKVGRLSDQRLLNRYLKISDEEVNECVDAMPMPAISAPPTIDTPPNSIGSC